MLQSKAQKWIHEWWGYPKSELPCEIDEWLQAAYKDGSSFWTELLPTSSHCEFGVSYTIYSDVCSRHINSRHPAITLLAKGGQRQSWTYKELHHSVNYHLSKWAKYDPKPGELVLIGYPLGVEFTVTLLWALRAGLKFCALPPPSPFLGAKELTQLIEEIKPNFIAGPVETTIPIDSHLLDFNLHGQDPEEWPTPPFSYEKASSIQLVLALARQSARTFVSLQAETLYLQALRDALFSLNLLENGTWASPLCCPLQHEPCSLLASLLAGSHRLWVQDEALAENPALLQDEKIELLGLNSSLEKLWSKSPGMPTKHLKAYYSSALDRPISKIFVEQHKLEKTPFFRLLMDSSFGGITLISRPQLDRSSPFLRPNVGMPFTLGKSYQEGYGIFQPLVGDDKNAKISTNFYVSSTEKEYLLSGHVNPCREGVTFPIEDLERLLKALPFVESCLIYPKPVSGRIFHANFYLLVFTDPTKPLLSDTEKRLYDQHIQTHLSEHLGKGFLPDSIEYFPLLPKMIEGSLHRPTCIRQYDSGWLHLKPTLPAYQALHTLKKLSQSNVKGGS